MKQNINIKWAIQDDAESLIKLNYLFNGISMELEEVMES